MPVTTAGTKASAAAPGATLSALTNGTPVFAAVTAISAAGESALSNTVCAVPTAASTTGLTLYDPLCGGTLDGTKWQTPQLSRGVGNSAMELGTQISNMESRTIQFLSYQTLLNVNSASRITTLKANITVPAATASRTGNAEVRAIVRLSYQPPVNRLNFPASRLNQLTVEIGLADTGGGLRAFRSSRHCDNASCTSRSATGIAFSDPAGFTPRASGYEAETAAAYDTTYTVSASLDESTGVFTWSFAGGAFGGVVSGTADPSLYPSGNANWTGSPLAGAGFLSAVLGTRVFDHSIQAGSDGSGSA